MLSVRVFRQAHAKIGSRTRNAVEAVAFQQRLKSSSAATCPVTGSAVSENVATNTNEPQLNIVPSLPFVGSTIRQHSGIPSEMGEGKEFKFWMNMREKYGDFYRLGIPGFGVGSHGLAHVVTCPHEFAKVIRSEGKYPSGVLQIQWGLQKALEEEMDSPITRGEDKGFFGRGMDWKRMRTFLQTDLLNPQAANGYVPGVIQAAELASKGAPAMSNDLNNYLNHCTFDMFNSIMFGQLVGTADSSTPTKEVDEEYVQSASTLLQTNNILNKDPYEIIMGKLGIKTEKYGIMVDHLKRVFQIGDSKVHQFTERKNRGELNDLEEKSWLAHAIERQAAGGTGITDEEMVAISGIILSASVDTTSSLLSWNLLHIALNQDVQERVHEELSTAIASTGSGDGRLSADIFNKKTTPYLHAVLRETFRLTPAAPLASFKKVGSEIEIHGQKFPEGSFFIFEGYSTGQRVFADDAQSFRPERWLPEAIDSRKGTPQAVIDHAFFRDPFSQGARKCPGSRVASNEAQVMLAQLLLDWKISVPGVDSHNEVPYKLMGAMAPIMPTMEFVPRSS
mmetsp:Transcript_9863/g.14610  ORF Transcript_9863/g.14610 Transcript_9863/m.14610 type:complete len:563 (+) Transcript_9863:59-1747(+)